MQVESGLDGPLAPARHDRLATPRPRRAVLVDGLADEGEHLLGGGIRVPMPAAAFTQHLQGRPVYDFDHLAATAMRQNPLLDPMDDVLDEILHEAREALSRQPADLMRKTESLRQLARTGIAAIAGVLAGTGLLAQAGLGVPVHAQVLLAAGTLLTVAAVVLAVASASLSDAQDFLVGPDPAALREMAQQGIDRRSLDHSRLEGLLRMLPYNASSLASTARRIRWTLVALVCGAVLASLGFAFVLGGAI